MARLALGETAYRQCCVFVSIRSGLSVSRCSFRQGRSLVPAVFSLAFSLSEYIAKNNAHHGTVHTGNLLPSRLKWLWPCRCFSQMRSRCVLGPTACQVTAWAISTSPWRDTPTVWSFWPSTTSLSSSWAAEATRCAMSPGAGPTRPPACRVSTFPMSALPPRAL